MRIAFVSVSGAMGGSEVVLVELLRGLRRLAPDWRAVVVVPAEGPLAARARALDADVFVLPFPTALARAGESGGLARRGATLIAAAGSIRGYVRKLRALLEAADPDVVHTNGFKAHIAAARALGGRRPLVWHIHEYVTPRPLSRRLLRATMSRVSAIVANSASVASDVRAALGDTRSITTIHNAVNLDEFAPDGPRADLAAIAGQSLGEGASVGLVATFGRWKGHEVFLRAVRELADRDVRVRPYIVGAPVYDTSGSQYSRDELERLAASLGLQGIVEFTGFVEQPAPLLRALDVVVHASTQPEPFGLVIAEAMACGRAVITSAGGGAAELVTDGVDALTHEPGDVRGLAAAIERLAADPVLRERLGRAARVRAAAQFGSDAFARAFLDVYTRVATTAISA